jgi:bifunctional enzyme CysN/CysC
MPATLTKEPPAAYAATSGSPAFFPREHTHSISGPVLTQTTPAREKDRFYIVVVGHVDHGKSTFVGRLLHDTDSLPHGKIEQVKKACAAENMDFEYAFLLDALLEEQEQNITIDTTRILFNTGKRDYAIIDAPGHREFLKNMVTGAASASAAFLLIDSREGVQDQSRRHALLLSLLGVKQLIVLVNKMDLSDYSEERFNGIVTEYTAFLSTLGLQPNHFIPITARHGENIANRGDNMPWWQGPTVIEALDSFTNTAALDDKPLRLPLQDVYRWDARRIFAGRIESGRIKPGDKIVFSPGNKAATVKTIENWNGPLLESAGTGESVGITLAEQIFVERGAVASPAENIPYITQTISARIFWLGREPLRQQRTYKIRLTTQETSCIITRIERVIDSATLESISSAEGHTLQINRHEVADITIRTHKPIVFDSHDNISPLGRFVITDNQQIAGGGILLVNDADGQKNDSHLHPTTGKVDRRARESRNGHPGAVIWLTGLSGSGKSTIAAELERQLFDLGRQVYWIDGDNLRLGLNSDLGFSEEDRQENIRRAGEIARHFADAGTILIISLISPSLASRNSVRDRVDRGRFIEVFVNAPLDVCALRDPKGLYAKAKTGEIQNFTGISAPYEIPTTPELELRTDQLSVGDCVAKILDRVNAITRTGDDWVSI